MKKIFGLFIFILLLGNVVAQNINQSNVPAVVLNEFQLKFPNAENVSWKLNKGNYLVYYKVNNKDNRLTLDNKGKTLKHQQDLYFSEIPKKVLEAIESKVTYFDIEDADRYENQGKIEYHLDFKHNGEDYHFRIDEKGRILKFRQGLRDNEIPESILSQIEKEFGKLDIDRAKYVEEPEKSIYIIRGEINDKDFLFVFDTKPNLLKYTKEVDKGDIPAPVINSFISAYKGYEIRSVDLLYEKGQTAYILQLRKSKKRIIVSISPEGKILKVK